MIFEKNAPAAAADKRWVAGEIFGLDIPADAATLVAGGTDFLTRAFHTSGALAADNTVSRIVAAREFSGGGTGKKLLLVGEQGLGDEIMFANILPDAQEAVGESGKLQICIDPRMIPLFQRSFPKAEVGAYDDRTLMDKDGNKALRLVPFASGANKPDLWAPMGTASRWKLSIRPATQVTRLTGARAVPSMALRENLPRVPFKQCG